MDGDNSGSKKGFLKQKRLGSFLEMAKVEWCGVVAFRF
jgi:hypothetical protein